MTSHRAAARLYRVTLAVLPTGLRRDFGDDMARLFDDQFGDARGVAARARLFVDAVGDVLRQSVAERWAGRRAPSFHPRSFMRNFLHDFQHGLRLLRRYPGTALVAIATLGLGIGANTAIFSVVDAVLLRSLPFPQPEQLVEIFEKRPAEGVMTNSVAPADYLDWRRESRSFRAMSVYLTSDVSFVGTGDPVVVLAGSVSPGFFGVIGMQPLIGRAFSAEEEATNAASRVAILTHSFWQQQFGGDPAILDKTILISGRPWRVIGVMPPDFHFLDRGLAMLAPAAFEGEQSRGAHFLDVYARLKPGVTLVAAANEMDAIGKRLEAQYPDSNHGHGANVVALQSALVQPVRTRLVVLLAAVGLVLLLACVNVASLMMVRSARREREMAVRAALGAGRARLFTQHLAESMALAVAGGLAGILLAWALIRLLPAVLPTQLSVVRTSELGLDPRVLAGAAALIGLTGLIFGIVPSLRASRPNLADPLKSGGRGAATLHPGFRTALVVGEVALATLTLVGAGLILRSFTLITSQPLGIATEGRLAMSLVARTARYPTPDAQLHAMEDLEARLAAAPGATAAGAIDILPLSGDDARRSVTIEGQPDNPDAPSRMHLRVVSPNYFGVVGMTLKQGRPFAGADAGDAPRVSIINEAAARRYWPGQDPVGKRWNFGRPKEGWTTVVGVVNDVRHWGLSQPVNPMVYLPLAQSVSNAMTFVVRTDQDAATFAASARATVKAFDPAMPTGTVDPLDAFVARSLRSDRAQTLLMGAFGALALLLAAVGIYGVMSQIVAARVQEIGIRLALGARSSHIVRLIVIGCAWQTVAGLTLGILAGASLAGLASTLLFGVSPWDPMTLTAVAIVLMAASMAACLIPVARALRVEAASAIRA